MLKFVFEISYFQSDITIPTKMEPRFLEDLGVPNQVEFRCFIDSYRLLALPQSKFLHYHIW